MKTALLKFRDTVIKFGEMVRRHTLPLLGIVAVETVVFLVAASTPFGVYSNHLAAAIVAIDLVAFSYLNGKRDSTVALWWFAINVATSALMLNSATILITGQELTWNSPIYGLFVVIILFFARGLCLFVTLSDQKA